MTAVYRVSLSESYSDLYVCTSVCSYERQLKTLHFLL